MPCPLSLGWWACHTNPSTTYGDHGVCLQGLGVAFQDLGKQTNPFRRRHIRQTDQACMWDPLHVDQRPEIRVDGDQDTVLGRRPAQQRCISRVGASVPGPDDIMTLRLEPGRHALPGTAIHQELHAGVPTIVSRLSPAITACAYARQA